MPGWKCSLNHPKITPELRKMLDDNFGRLAELNVKSTHSKLTEEEQLERDFLASLHEDFRHGRRKFKPFIGKRYFKDL